MNYKNNQLSSRFKQVFHNTGFGIMIVDKNRNLIEVNPKFCEMLGYTKEELIGKNAEILHISNKTFYLLKNDYINEKNKCVYRSKNCKSLEAKRV